MAVEIHGTSSYIYIESTELTRETATRPRVCFERWSVLIVSRGNVIILIRIGLGKNIYRGFLSPNESLISPSLSHTSTIFFFHQFFKKTLNRTNMRGIDLKKNTNFKGINFSFHKRNCINRVCRLGNFIKIFYTSIKLVASFFLIKVGS